VIYGAILSERSLCRQEARRFLEQALARLKPATRELLWRHYFWGERLSELAAAQGKTPDAARMQVQRGLERLRSILGEMGLGWDEIKTYLSDFILPPPTN
jgi:DNA-directed RNA polymerase specialized sigma24 family protein